MFDYMHADLEQLRRSLAMSPSLPAGTVETLLDELAALRDRQQALFADIVVIGDLVDRLRTASSPAA